MIKNSFLIIILLAIVSIGCKKNDNSESGTTTPYVIDYKNQDLQGMINGQPWNYQRGGAFTYSIENTHEIGLYADLDDSCIGGVNPSVLIHLENVDFIGSYKLGSGSQIDPINIYYFDNDYFNQYPKKGGFEIISADTITGMVTGRIDAWYNAGNYVNGNFEIKYCDYFK